MHHAFRRARIYIRRTYGGWHGAWPPCKDFTETSRAGFSPWLTSPRWSIPHSESPHEFSMRLAAHLCGDRPHRHHRARTKLVNLLTARTLSVGVSSASWCTHHACTCRTNSSVALVSGCAMVRENTMFLAALIIWLHLKSPTTAMLMGIDGTIDHPNYLYSQPLLAFNALFCIILRKIFERGIFLPCGFSNSCSLKYLQSVCIVSTII